MRITIIATGFNKKPEDTTAQRVVATPKAEAAPVRKVERVAPVAKAESNDGDLLDYANSFYRKK